MRRKILIGFALTLLPVALLAQAPVAPPAQTPPAAAPRQAPAAPAQTPPAAAPRQAPAAAPPAAGTATGGTRVAVVDFQRAIVENTEGKKAQEEFLAEVNKRQGEFDKKQKALDDMGTKLRTQDKALSDEAKADLNRQMERTNTELQRMNDDAQKELGDLQQRLFRPIAERATKVLNAYAAETGFAVVFDVSSQANNIIYVQDVADITTEIIRRVDAEAAKSPKPAEPSSKK